MPGYTEEESRKIYDQLLYLLCSPGHIGTMFQATSTNDITFWVLHPTVDRYGSKRLSIFSVLSSCGLSISSALLTRASF